MKNEYRKLDSISITSADVNMLFEWKENHKEYVRDFNPVMNEGLIDITDGPHKQTFKDDGISVTYMVYHEVGKSSKLVHSLAWNKDTRVGVTTFSTLDKKIEDDFNNSVISIHAILMAYMEYYFDKKEYVDLKAVDRKETRKYVEKETRKKVNKVVKIKQKKYTVSANEESAKRDTRRYERSTEQWSVRGHWRETKTGKRVWIKGHSKGDGDKSPKTYKL